MRASALEASVNELIDTIFGCYLSSKAADVVPKGVPTIWHKSTACHLAHALKMGVYIQQGARDACARYPGVELMPCLGLVIE
jgi:hypothetical protein